jgi:hypothetical protein
MPDEATGEVKAKKWICEYCAQERVINWVDPLIVSRLQGSIEDGHKKKYVTVNAQFSMAKLRRVKYSNGDTVDELLLRAKPN